MFSFIEFERSLNEKQKSILTLRSFSSSLRDFLFGLSVDLTSIIGRDLKRNTFSLSEPTIMSE